jgi:hypothetical protein
MMVWAHALPLHKTPVVQQQHMNHMKVCLVTRHFPFLLSRITIRENICREEEDDDEETMPWHGMVAKRQQVG